MFARLRTSLLTFANDLGISNALAASRWRRDRLLVLCYHGVALQDEHRWNPTLYVSAATLERRLERIRAMKCTVLPLGEAIERLYRRDLPDRAVALTFDDGYFDFLARALPLLDSFGYPATVYLATGRVDHNRPVAGPVLSYAMWKARGGSIEIPEVPGFEGPLPLASATERRRIVKAVQTHTTETGMTGTQRDEFVKSLIERLGVDYGALERSRILTLMNPAEVQQLASRGVDFQLHTHWHRTPENPDQFLTEVRVNGERILAMTGRRPTHFCYPSGIYRESYLGLLRGEGVVSATTCERGLAEVATNPLLMPRFIDTETTSPVEFSGWLTGAAAWLPQRTKPGGLIRVPSSAALSIVMGLFGAGW